MSVDLSHYWPTWEDMYTAMRKTLGSGYCPHWPETQSEVLESIENHGEFFCKRCDFGVAS